MKMQLAVFKTEYSSDTVATEFGDDVKEWVRLTEFVDVEFPDLPKDDVVAKQLAQIDREEQEARAKFQMVLDMINGKRKDLLALVQS